MDGPNRRAPIERITPVQHEPIEHVPIQRAPITPIQRAPTGHASITGSPIGPPIAKSPITPVQPTPIERIPISREPITPIEHITPVQHAPIEHAPIIRLPIAPPIARMPLPIEHAPIQPTPIMGGAPIAYLPRGGLTHNQGIIITPRRSILPSNALSELRKEAEKKNATQHGIVLAPIKSRLPSPSAPPLNQHEIIPGLPQVAQLVSNGGELGLHLFLQDLQRQGIPLNYNNIVNYFVKQGVGLGEARGLANKVEQYLLEEHLSRVQASLPKLPPSPIPTSPAGASSSPPSLTGFLNSLIHVAVTPLNNQYINTNAKLYTANINIDQVMKEVDQFLKQHPVLAANAFPFAGFINNQLMINEDALRSWLTNYYQAYLTELNLPGAENVISFITSYYKKNPGMMQELIGGLTNAYAGALTLTGLFL